MTYDEVEVVADAGVRLRIIADGLIAAAKVTDLTFPGTGDYLRSWARAVDEVRVRLCALPIESEGEAA